MNYNNKILEAPLIMMCGISGSGKTHISRELELHGFTRLSADEIIWEMYGTELDSLPFADKKEIFKSIDSFIYERAGLLLEQGKRPVIDATMCKRMKRDNIRRLCEQYEITPLIIYLKAPLPLLKKRLSARLGSGPDDQIVTQEQLVSFFENFEPPQEDENYCIINFKDE